MKNKDNYDRLKYDPTETHSRLINDTIERFKKQKMKEKVAKGLKTENPRTAKFYLQPKIHKRGNPGHPVVSSVNCHTSNISEYVGYHMQPIAKEIPSSCFTFCHWIKNIKLFKFEHEISLQNKMNLLKTNFMPTLLPSQVTYGKWKKVAPSLTWEAFRTTKTYSNITKRCSLCLHEKLAIITYPYPDEPLNKRSELVTKCRHENKFLLKNFNSNDWSFEPYYNLT